VQRAGSGASWWRRISSATSRRPELGKVTVCSGWRLPPRFLALGDEDDDEEHAGQVFGARGGCWPRRFTTAARLRSDDSFPDDGELQGEGKRWWACPGGRGRRPYRADAGREQVEAGPACQRRAHGGRRTGAGGSRWEEEDKGVGVGCGGPRPRRVLIIFLLFCFFFCYYLFVIILYT